MPKSKNRKKHKKRVNQYKIDIQATKKRLKEDMMKKFQQQMLEKHNEMIKQNPDGDNEHSVDLDLDIDDLITNDLDIDDLITNDLNIDDLIVEDSSEDSSQNT